MNVGRSTASGGAILLSLTDSLRNFMTISDVSRSTDEAPEEVEVVAMKNASWVRPVKCLADKAHHGLTYYHYYYHSSRDRPIFVCILRLTPVREYMNNVHACG